MKIHTAMVEHYKPDKKTEKRLQKAAREQKETGVHYGKQQAQRYIDRHGVERVKIGHKLYKAVADSAFSMSSLSRDLGYDKSWLSQRCRDKSYIEMKQLRRICVVIRKRPEEVMEDEWSK